jgi:hypothetical protein
MFWLLFLICTLIARSVAKAAAQLVKWERMHWLIQSIGCVLGGLRGVWWAAFLVVALSSCGFAYLRDSVEQRSIAGPLLLKDARNLLRDVARWFPGTRHQTDPLIPPLRPLPKS